MARIRTIKPEFWTSEQVVDCSAHARLMFIGLWNFADDGGVHPTNLKRIKMNIFPGDEIELSTVRRLIDELEAVGLIELYEVENKEYLRITGWLAHQKIEKPSYKYPNRAGVVPKRGDKLDDDRRPVVDRSPPDRNRIDSGNGMELDSTQSTTDPKPEEQNAEKQRARMVNDQAAEIFARIEPLLNLAKPLPFAPIKGWVQAGYDPDLDILPAITEALAKRQRSEPGWKPHSLNYFADVIKKAHADRVTNARPSAATPLCAKPLFTGSDADGRAKLLGVYAGLLKSGRNLPDITQADVEEMLGSSLITAEDAQRAGFAA